MERRSLHRSPPRSRRSFLKPQNRRREARHRRRRPHHPETLRPTTPHPFRRQTLEGSSHPRHLINLVPYNVEAFLASRLPHHRYFLGGGVLKLQMRSRKPLSKISFIEDCSCEPNVAIRA